MKQKLDIEKIRELETIAKELNAEKLRLSAVSKSFYCLGDSWGESGKCDKQCEDCKLKVLKQ
jgi:hypothetical protein